MGRRSQDNNLYLCTRNGTQSKEPNVKEKKKGRARKTIDVDKFKELAQQGLNCVQIGKYFGMRPSMFSERAREALGFYPSQYIAELQKSNFQKAPSEKPRKKNKDPGRPRTTTPEPPELIKLGEEMVRWFEEHPDAVHYTEWFSIHKGILISEWDDMCHKPEFRVYYERVRMILASRHMKGAVKEGIAHRFLGMYLGDLKEHEIELMKLKAELSRRQEIELSGQVDMHTLFGLAENSSKKLLREESDTDSSLDSLLL